MDFVKKYFSIAIFPAAMLVLAGALLAAGHRVSVLEFTGVMLAITGMALAKKQIAWGQLVIFVSQAILIFYFWANEVYGAVAFAAVWGVISIVTYINWVRPRSAAGKSELEPSFASKWLVAAVMAGAAAIVLWRAQQGLGFVRSIEWLAPYFGLMGQILLVNKKIQGWLLFVLSVTVMAVLMASISSWMLLARNLMFMIIGTTALIKWADEARVKV